jgi:nitrite reductase/ring-hydroxylating ferredoxin subunit
VRLLLVGPLPGSPGAGAGAAAVGWEALVEALGDRGHQLSAGPAPWVSPTSQDFDAVIVTGSAAVGIGRLVPGAAPTRLVFLDADLPAAADDGVDPSGWTAPPRCAYVQLDPERAAAAAEADARAWSVERVGPGAGGLPNAPAVSAVGLAIVIDTVLRRIRVRAGQLATIRGHAGVAVVTGPHHRALVVVPSTGPPRAVALHCPHQGAELTAGYVHATGGRPWIECPLHSWRFDLETGARLVRDEPSSEPWDRIATYPCAVDRSATVWVEFTT